jgi:hypothetical protein
MPDKAAATAYTVNLVKKPKSRIAAALRENSAVDE